MRTTFARVGVEFTATWRAVDAVDPDAVLYLNPDDDGVWVRTDERVAIRGYLLCADR